MKKSRKIPGERGRIFASLQIGYQLHLVRVFRFADQLVYLRFRVGSLSAHEQSVFHDPKLLFPNPFLFFLLSLIRLKLIRFPLIHVLFLLV